MKNWEVKENNTSRCFYIKSENLETAKIRAIQSLKPKIEDLTITETNKVFIDDITDMMPRAKYAVDVSWKDIETYLIQFSEGLELQLEPDFQRNHVWTKEQQVAYIEYIMRQGITGRDIYFNCATWNDFKHNNNTMVLVDGLQRLTAVRKFINNEFTIFDDKFAKDFCIIDSLNCAFKIHINDLQTKKEVLQWYLDFNSAGTVHTIEELNRVKELLKKMENKELIEIRNQEYLVKLQEQVKNDYLGKYPSEYALNNIPQLTLEKGSKYTKIVVRGSSVFGFIENATGLLWKAASWKSPAKNFPRGNIADTEGLKKVRWTGIE